MSIKPLTFTESIEIARSCGYIVRLDRLDSGEPMVDLDLRPSLRKVKGEDVVPVESNLIERIPDCVNYLLINRFGRNILEDVPVEPIEYGLKAGIAIDITEHGLEIVKSNPAVVCESISLPEMVSLLLPALSSQADDLYAISVDGDICLFLQHHGVVYVQV